MADGVPDCGLQRVSSPRIQKDKEDAYQYAKDPGHVRDDSNILTFSDWAPQPTPAARVWLPCGGSTTSSPCPFLPSRSLAPFRCWAWLQRYSALPR
ncbi:hypothetical protein ANO11243_044220 [Dothideomycetidae sp. 11243]|nr:hypothetical protein ANO11243_044220 [fungal sp. No.11243]